MLAAYLKRRWGGGEGEGKGAGADFEEKRFHSNPFVINDKMLPFNAYNTTS